MALFKILKGPEYETVNGEQVSRLPNTYHEGYCYFTTDTHKFYIDISDVQDPSSRVELYTALSDYAVRAYNDQDGLSIKNTYVKSGATSSLDPNEMLITDNSKNVTTRKLVDGYNIVAALPNGQLADQNVIYLIEDGEDSGGGSSGGGGVTITNTLATGNLIATINGTNIYIPTNVSTFVNDANYIKYHDVLVSWDYDEQTDEDILTLNETYQNISSWINNNETVVLKTATSDSIYYYTGKGDRGEIFFSTQSGQTIRVHSSGVYEDDFSYALREEVPINTSDLYNDSGYITLADLPIYDGTVV